MTQTLGQHTVIVVGGTANIGAFVVPALLERGARVVVPSRTQARLNALREHLSGVDRDHLHTLVGDFGDEAQAADLRQRITDEAGAPTGLVAALGDFVTTSSLLDTPADDLRRALDGYVVAHCLAARAFLPTLMSAGGTYVLLQGPLAFERHPELGTDLISVATAAQHMLFRTLADYAQGSMARVVELVVRALIRDRQTQPQSPLPGEAIGAYVASLLGAGDEVHGQSIELSALEQLQAAGIDPTLLSGTATPGSP